MKAIKLNTGVVITYDNKGNIKDCISDYDNAVTKKPLPKQ